MWRTEKGGLTASYGTHTFNRHAKQLHPDLHLDRRMSRSISSSCSWKGGKTKSIKGKRGKTGREKETARQTGWPTRRQTDRRTEAFRLSDHRLLSVWWPTTWSWCQGPTECVCVFVSEWVLCEEVSACVMGNTESMESQLAVIRSRAAPVRLPMPDPAELEERFSIALVNAPHSLPNTHTHAHQIQIVWLPVCTV